MNIGVLFALFSALLFGASTPFAKLFLGTVDPWMMAGLLYIGSGLGLMLVHLTRGIFRLPDIEAPLRRSDVPWLALVITVGGVLGPLGQAHDQQHPRRALGRGVDTGDRCVGCHGMRTKPDLPMGAHRRRDCQRKRREVSLPVAGDRKSVV